MFRDTSVEPICQIASARVSANGKLISAHVDFLRNPLFHPSTAFKELAVSPISLLLEFGKRDNLDKASGFLRYSGIPLLPSSQEV
jgi:hypothetical protein